MIRASPLALKGGIFKPFNGVRLKYFNHNPIRGCEQ